MKEPSTVNSQEAVLEIQKAHSSILRASTIIDELDIFPAELAYVLDYLHSSYRSLEDKVADLHERDDATFYSS